MFESMGINYQTTAWTCSKTRELRCESSFKNHSKIRSHHATLYLNELKWLKIESKVTFDICIFTYKIVNNLIPEWLLSLPRVRNTSNRHTRQSDDLFIPRTKTEIGARAISVTGPRAWNMIPKNIRDAGTIKVFKEKLKKYLMEK